MNEEDGFGKFAVYDCRGGGEHHLGRGTPGEGRRGYK